MVDDEPELAEVIQLRPGMDLADEDRPLHSRPREPGAEWCHHKRFTLDAESQRAYCRECGREVPLFEVLDKITREPERWVAFRKEAERRAKVALGNADELERVEANAKARLRRLRKLGVTVEHDELRDAAQRALRELRGQRLAVFAADEATAFEVRRHLRGSDVLIDPLMMPWSWRVGPHPDAGG